MKKRRTSPMIDVVLVEPFALGYRLWTGTGLALSTCEACVGVSPAARYAFSTPRYSATSWTRARSAGELVELAGSLTKTRALLMIAKSTFPERRPAFAAV